MAGSNSGRYVMISNPPSRFSRSTVRPSVSRLVGSTQCTSSKIISTGLLRQRLDLLRECFHVFCRRCCGGISSADSVRRLTATAFQQAVRRLRGRKTLREHCIEFVEFRLRGVVVRESSGSFHLADYRI